MPYVNSVLRALAAVGLLLVAAPGLRAQDAPRTLLRGDVDGDGRVTRADADAVRAWLVRGTLPGGRGIMPAGDANGDGRVTAADAALISRFAAGVDVSRFAVGRPVGTAGERASSAGTLVSVEYECTADFGSGSLTCAPVSSMTESGARLDVMLGVEAAKIVNIGGGAYSGADKSNPDTMTYNFALKNLIPQPIGTTDGTTPDTSRLVVTSYRLTSPTPATAQLDNADGTATFVDSLNFPADSTFPNVEYMDYPGLLKQDSVSPSKFFRFVFSPSVTAMRFTYRVWTRVQYRHGYITLAPATSPEFNPRTEATFTGTVYNHLGQVQADGITWSSSNPSVAAVDAGTGVVTAVAVGTATITATSTVNAQRTGSLDITVTSVNTWEGDVSSDWSTAGNWSASVVPDAATEAVIPAAGSIPNMPVLTANASVLDLSLGTGSTLGLGGFTLRAYDDVAATGTISTGTLWLSGSSAAVQGSIGGAVLVSGSAALQGATKTTGAVSVTGSLTVSSGALTISVP